MWRFPAHLVIDGFLPSQRTKRGDFGSRLQMLTYITFAMAWWTSILQRNRWWIRIRFCLLAERMIFGSVVRSPRSWSASEARNELRLICLRVTLRFWRSRRILRERFGRAEIKDFCAMRTAN